MEMQDHSAAIVAKDQIPSKKTKMWGPFSSVFFTIVIYFASQVVAGLVIWTYAAMRGWNSGTTSSWLTTSVLAQFIIIFLIEALVVLAVYLLLKVRKLPLKTIGLVKPKWFVDGSYALAGFGIYFISYLVIFLLVQQFVPQINLDQKQQIGFDVNQTGLSLLWIFLSLVILPPIAEEILCRGFLYTGIKTKLRFWPAAIITSVLFGVVHLQIGSGEPLLWAAGIDTFILSMILVYLRQQRQSLVSPIMVHMLKNGMAFMLLFIFKVG